MNTLSIDDELQRIIYTGNEGNVMDFLSKNDITKLSANYDFLTYPIKKGYNGIIRTLLYMGNVNVRAMDSIALTVSKIAGNRDAYNMIKDILSDPICNLYLDFWDSKETKKSKVYKYSRTSTLTSYLDSYLSYPYKLMIDGLIIDDPQEMLIDLLSIQTESKNRFKKCGKSDKIKDHRIYICIFSGGEVYPPEKITVLANMVDYLTPSQIKIIWEDVGVVRDGTIRKILESGKPLPHYMNPTKDDIDYLYTQGKIHCCIERLQTQSLIRLVRRCIMDDNSKTLNLIYKTSKWKGNTGLFNPFVLCVEYTSIDCLRVTINNSNMSPAMNNNAVVKLAIKIGDDAALKLLNDAIGELNPLDNIPSKLINNDKTNLTFSDVSVSTK